MHTSLRQSPKAMLYLVMILFTLALIVVHSQVGLGEYGLTDDLYFDKWTNETDYVSWITLRYTTLNGRLLAETAVYAFFRSNIWLWRVINSLVFGLLGYVLARYATGPTNQKAMPNFLLLSFTLLGIASAGIMAEAAFSMNTSFYYLWPAAFGFIALLPLWERVVHQADRRPTVFHFLAGLYASLAQEQVTLFLIGMFVVLLVLEFRQTRRVPTPYWFQAGMLVAGAIIMFTSPGNPIRFAWSVDLYNPGFDTFSPLTKVLLGMNYLFTSLVLLNRPLFLVFAAIAIPYLANQTKRQWLAFGLAAYLGAAVVVMLLSLDPLHAPNITRWLLDFEHLIQYNAQTASTMIGMGGNLVRSLISMAFWGLLYGLVIPIVLVWLLDHKQPSSLAVLFLYFGGIAALVTMFFSPTMNESGERTRFLFTLTWIILLLSLLWQRLPITLQESRKLLLFFLPVPLGLLMAYTLIANDFSLAVPLTITSEWVENPQLECTVDRLNATEPMAEVQGWVFYSGLDSAGNQNAGAYQKILLLSDTEQEYALSTTLYIRPEITQRMNNGLNYDQSGFYTYINLLDFRPGEYQVAVGLLDQNLQPLGFCKTGQRLLVK